MNQVIFWTVGVFLGILTASAQNTIKVEMTNFSNNEGAALVGLYDNEGNFLEKEWKTIESKIENQTAQAIFTNVPDGVYAISVFHDEDGDKELDMLMGIRPTEDYGTSNNAPSRFGPPQWTDAKFEVKNGETVVQKISL